MIGANITEQEYRDLDLPSYSALSGISRNGHNSLKDEFKPNDATKYGILVESILFDDYNPDDYYIMKYKLSDGKLKDACDIIFPILIENKANSNNLSSYINLISNILLNTYIDYWDKKDNQWRANKIINEKGVDIYWKSYLESKGKIVITQYMLDSAHNAVNALKSHEFTKDIFSKLTFSNVDKQSQVKLVFNYKNYKLKAMLDWLVIDHDNKVIKPYDLKTGGKSVEEFEESFFYWRYDIQAYLYTVAVIDFRNRVYPDYDIDTFKFIYISRNNTDRVLIYKAKNKQYEATLRGFYRKGEYYKGIIKLIEEYDWYLKNEKAEYPEEVYKNSGEVFIADNIIIDNAKD